MSEKNQIQMMEVNILVSILLRHYQELPREKTQQDSESLTLRYQVKNWILVWFSL